LKMRPPLWWRIFGLAQLLLAVVAMVGLVWLVVLVVLGWLALSEIHPPRLGPLPYPLLMFAGGLLIGLGLASLSRSLGRVGARRRGQHVRALLLGAMSTVASDQIMAPVRAVLVRHRDTRGALDRAAH
jgi:hypothetical protein